MLHGKNFVWAAVAAGTHLSSVTFAKPVPPPPAEAYFDGFRETGSAHGFGSDEGRRFLETYYHDSACFYQPDPNGPPSIAEVCGIRKMATALQQYPQSQWATMKLGENSNFKVGPLLDTAAGEDHDGGRCDSEKPAFGQWTWCIDMTAMGGRPDVCYHQMFVYRFEEASGSWKIRYDIGVNHGALTNSESSSADAGNTKEDYGFATVPVPGGVAATVALPPKLYSDVYAVGQNFDGKDWRKFIQDMYMDDAWNIFPQGQNVNDRSQKGGSGGKGKEQQSLVVLENDADLEKSALFKFYDQLAGVASAFPRGTILYSNGQPGAVPARGDPAEKHPTILMCLEYLSGDKKGELYALPTPDGKTQTPCFVDVQVLVEGEKADGGTKLKIQYEFQSNVEAVDVGRAKVVAAVPTPSSNPRAYLQHVKHVALTYGWKSEEAKKLVRDWYSPSACVYNVAALPHLDAYCGEEEILASYRSYPPDAFATMSPDERRPPREGPYVWKEENTPDYKPFAHGFADPTKNFFMLFDWCMMGDESGERMCFHQYYVYEYAGAGLGNDRCGNDRVDEPGCWKIKFDISAPFGFYEPQISGDTQSPAKQAVPEALMQYANKWAAFPADNAEQWQEFVGDVYTADAIGTFPNTDERQKHSLSALEGLNSMVSYYAPFTAVGAMAERRGRVVYGGDGVKAPLMWMWYGCVTHTRGASKGEVFASDGVFSTPCFTDFMMFEKSGKGIMQPLKVFLDMQDEAPVAKNLAPTQLESLEKQLAQGKSEQKQEAAKQKAAATTAAEKAQAAAREQPEGSRSRQSAAAGSSASSAPGTTGATQQATESAAAAASSTSSSGLAGLFGGGGGPGPLLLVEEERNTATEEAAGAYLGTTNFALFGFFAVLATVLFREWKLRVGEAANSMNPQLTENLL